jgi:hypothetical protein
MMQEERGQKKKRTEGEKSSGRKKRGRGGIEHPKTREIIAEFQKNHQHHLT